MRPHGTQTELERRRRRAVELLGKGMNLSAVSEKIGCSVSSVHLWKEEYAKNGEDDRDEDENRAAGHVSLLYASASLFSTLVSCACGETLIVCCHTLCHACVDEVV